jgi:hypothetical protein
VIRLNDGKPWFRRWMWIGYRPITDEGRTLVSIGAGVSLIAGVVALLTEGASPWTELGFILAIPAVIAVNAIAFFKMEDRF